MILPIVKLQLIYLLNDLKVKPMSIILEAFAHISTSSI